jgi:SAM-dependent methyltransferase
MNDFTAFSNAVIKRCLPYHYYSELEKAMGNCNCVLDVGCGSNSPLRYIRAKIKYSVGVDIDKKSIENSKQKQIHDQYYEMNVNDIHKKFQQNEFECVLASDIIEHLSKKDGQKLIDKMERIGCRRVIILTPNGYLEQSDLHDNPHQRHLSGWSVEELKSLGYKVTGINGWKPLRGEGCEIRLRPKIFWMTVSIVSQIWVRNRPLHAFQLLGVKILQKEK